MADSPKAYQFIFTLYPESQQYAIDYVKEHWSCAWALHDKDPYDAEDLKEYAKDHGGDCPPWNVGDLKKPHVHFVVRFKNQRYASGVAKELRNKAFCSVSNTAIRRCFNLYKSYVYLWHENEEDKYKYDPDIVGLHDFDPPAQNEGVSEEEQVATMFDMPKCHSVKELARWAYDNGCWSTFRKNYNLWKDIWQETVKGRADYVDVD